MKKCPALTIISFLIYIGLALVSFYILTAGPVEDLIRNETIFTESLQNTNGKEVLTLREHPRCANAHNCLGLKNTELNLDV